MRCIVLFALIAVAISADYGAFFRKGKWEVTTGEHGPQNDLAATCNFEDTRSTDGWTRLHLSVNTRSLLSDSQRYFGAGYLEGYVTQKLIFAAYYNFANGTGLPMSTPMQTLVQSQQQWMAQQVAAQPKDSYWNSLSRFLQQYEGIIAGYNAAAPSQEQLSSMQLWAYALQFEIGDYAAATKTNKGHAAFATPHGRRKLMGEHCSVLFKLAENNADALMSHITWSSFNTMLRVYKTYDLPYSRVQVSSYPGLPYSGDDWVLTNKGLVIVETTNEIFNMSCYKYLTAQTIPYFLRVQVAAEASTPQQWHQLFKRYNNGGYNNQWMVFNARAFQKGRSLPAGTFWVGEQTPGLYVDKDQSQWLQQNGYWASYNVPFYRDIWLYSGYEPMYKQYGNAYSWSECARAQIYRRDQHTVTDLNSLKRIQRYNQWQSDPLSLKDACRGIAARCDLNAPWSNNTLNGFSAFGAIDAKVANAEMVLQMRTHAVAGPTYDSQPIFWWSNAWNHVPHKELPLVYAFDFVEMTSNA